jgi:hypothetical protein
MFFFIASPHMPICGADQGRKLRMDYSSRFFPGNRPGRTRAAAFGAGGVQWIFATTGKRVCRLPLSRNDLNWI